MQLAACAWVVPRESSACRGRAASAYALAVTATASGLPASQRSGRVPSPVAGLRSGARIPPNCFPIGGGKSRGSFGDSKGDGKTVTLAPAQVNAVTNKTALHSVAMGTLNRCLAAPAGLTSSPPPLASHATLHIQGV
jgi:hypothetical protein